VSVADRTAYVEHFNTLEAQKLVEVLNEMHLGASVQERGESGGAVSRCNKEEMGRAAHVVVQVTLLAVGLTVGTDEVKFVYVACIALSFSLFAKAWSALTMMRANVEFLMATAMLGSIAQGALREAAVVGVVVTLMDSVVWLSVTAVDRHLRSSISIPPATITLKDGTVIPAANLKAGMVFLVRAGDGVPADGTVAKGKGTIDESRVTGEALPVQKEIGMKVFSGSVLQRGYLDVTADADVDASFQAKVLESVQQAKNTVSNTQAVVGKFAAYYTPLVILLATAIAIAQHDFNQFLVIIVAGCPCALLGAAPFVQAAALAVLARRHRLLVKETVALESLARMQWLGIDKTGTITTGQFKLIKMKSVSKFTQKDLHKWAAAIETKDNHPLAQSIVQSYTGCLVAFAGWDGLPEVTKFSREGRSGVKANIEGRTVGVGNNDFLVALGIPLEGKAAKLSQEWATEGTVLFVTVDQSVAGMLLMDDSMRGDTVGTIAKLKSLGIETVLLTGDKKFNADRVAAAAGIDSVHAGLLPEDKARILLQASWGKDSSQTRDLEKGLLDSSRRGPVEVGFVGDGLNDCPALANANVGIVMQEVGSQATVDAASAVLQGELGQIPAAVVIARRAQRLVIANILLALGINLCVIIAAATVGISLWLSVLMDNGTLLAVLLNSLWPLCWRVDPVPDTSKADLDANGGVVAFRARGESANDLDMNV